MGWCTPLLNRVLVPLKAGIPDHAHAHAGLADVREPITTRGCV